MSRLACVRLFAVLLCSLSVSGCGRHTERDVPAPLAAREVIDNGAEGMFTEQRVEGAFVLSDACSRVTTVVNPRLASSGFLPASTFKIPNTLIGLTTGVIADEHFALRWDGTLHPESAAWNRNHDLASAMKHSVVWFYQEVARRIGEARMQQAVDQLAYGNRSIAGGIDRFWLTGGMRITPRQQVEFLSRLERGQLPVAPEHAALVKRLTLLERRGDVVLRGKTGLTTQGSQAVGWFVGAVERPCGMAVFATLLLTPEADGARMFPLRQMLGRRLLVRRGILPASMQQPG